MLLIHLYINTLISKTKKPETQINEFRGKKTEKNGSPAMVKFQPEPLRRIF